MAAAPERHAPEIIELTRFDAGDLDPVLDEERLAWRSTLNWDFSASGELVRRFVNIQALSGYALVCDKKVAGYAYYVCEDRKGLVGDIYILRDFSTAENEDALLSATLHALVGTLGVERIEAQLMMLRGPFERSLPFARHAQIYPRLFMLIDLDQAAQLPPRKLDGISVDEWDDSQREECALLIATAYQGHIDASINDQYRSYPGAKRFLNNVVNYPGCGSFSDLASLVARDHHGKIVGAILSSMVAPDVGHITQICIAPEAQGRGIGYELVRRALTALASAGCERTSLTVTASNTQAVRLYQNMGFRSIRRFAAYVWEGF
jgi:ribosomal protein S18 acetylase RimI-like enzyme